MKPRRENAVLLTQARLKELLRYSRTTGQFTRRVARKKHCKGEVAGTVSGTGKRRFVNIKINGTIYVAGRLAWLWVKGEFPKGIIEQKNGRRTDNRWKNLRETTRAAIKARAGGGVYRRKNCPNRSWVARINKDGRTIYIGTYRTKREGIEARKKAVRKLFG
jgi:hypothetical protein